MRLYFGALSLLSRGASRLRCRELILLLDGLIRAPPPVDWISPAVRSKNGLRRLRSTSATQSIRRPVAARNCSRDPKSCIWWEWLRRASFAALAAGAAVGFDDIARACGRDLCFVVAAGVGGSALLVFAYWIARNVVELSTREIEALSRFNVVTVSPRDRRGVRERSGRRRSRVGRRPARSRAGRDRSIELIAPNGCGSPSFSSISVSAACSRAATRRHSGGRGPDTEGHVLPPLEQLTSYSPWWLNFTFNPYTIQLVHRTLSAALWIAALWQLVAPMLRAHRLKQAIVRFVLITRRCLPGSPPSLLIAPAVLSIVHQVGPIFMLAASLVFLKSSRGTAGGALTRARPAR